jgi:hypothetical protein
VRTRGERTIHSLSGTDSNGMTPTSTAARDPRLGLPRIGDDVVPPLSLGSLLFVAALLVSCTDEAPAPNIPVTPPKGAPASDEGRQVSGTIAPNDDAMSVDEFCAKCHLLPPPESLLDVQWPGHISTMYELALGDADLASSGLPPLEVAVARFVSRAPSMFPPVDSTADRGPGGARFARRPVRFPGYEPLPAISCVQIVRFSHSRYLDVLACDMRFGDVWLVQPPAPGRTPAAVRLAQLRHPSHVVAVDLDQDGHLDVLAADLGTVTPSDVTTGSVEWIRGVGELRFERKEILSGLGRVADARAADFDGDGDLDIVVAVFGWRKIGQILYLENRAEKGAPPRFEPSELDSRTGAIHVPPIDIDGDGRLDFIALFSQQHESVVAFLQRGPATFQPVTLYLAPHPAWGSSGIDLVDLDADGDTDILFANGDTLDDYAVKPYHGITWLENRGNLEFRAHRLTDLYGTHFAKAGDIDGDGDLDLAAATFLPFNWPDSPHAPLTEGIVWLEQFRPGEFRRFPLETVHTYHPTLDLGDLDGDGDPDIVVGNMTMAKRRQDTIDHSILILENTRVSVR